MHHNDCFIAIAGVRFGLDIADDMAIFGNFREFIIRDGTNVDCICTIQENNLLPSDENVRINHDICLVFDENGTCRTRYLINPMTRTRYVCGVATIIGEQYDIQIVQEGYRIPNLNQYFQLIGWEQIMLWHERLILHASFIESEFGGILFSGVSGIGKSTQADLWVKYKDAELINGDRTIISKEGDVWYAYGSPFAGSSHCFKNRKVHITAIVMLRQGEENEIESLPVNNAFHMLYKETTAYTWDKEYMERLVNLLTGLAFEVPVYQLTCTPDEQAVETLERILRRDGGKYQR